MTEQEQTIQTEQPATQDSAAGELLREGGVTPKADAILANLPPQDAAALREEIATKNARVEEVQRNVAAQRQALQQDIQMAGVLRECMKDSDFAEYLQHKERGTLATYYREKVGAPASPQIPAAEESNQAASAEPGETGNVTSDPEVASLSKRIAQMELDRAKSAQKVEIEQFAKNYPDWEKYQEAMQSVRNVNRQSSLSDIYFIAKGMVEQGATQKVPASAEAQQAAEQQTSGESAQLSPPLPVGNPPGSTTPASPIAKTMAEAMKQARDTHGIEGDFRVHYE